MGPTSGHGVKSQESGVVGESNTLSLSIPKQYLYRIGKVQCPSNQFLCSMEKKPFDCIKFRAEVSLTRFNNRAEIRFNDRTAGKAHRTKFCSMDIGLLLAPTYTFPRLTRGCCCPVLFNFSLFPSQLRKHTGVIILLFNFLLISN